MPSKLRVNKSTPPAEPRTRRLSARSHPLLKPLTPHRQKLLKAGDRSLPRAQDSSHLLHSQHSCHTITDFIPQAIHLEVHFSQAGLHQHHYPGCVCPQTGRCQLNYLHNPSPLSTAFIPRDRLLLHLSDIRKVIWKHHQAGSVPALDTSPVWHSSTGRAVRVTKGISLQIKPCTYTCSLPYALKLVKGASWDFIFIFPMRSILSGAIFILQALWAEQKSAMGDFCLIWLWPTAMRGSFFRRCLKAWGAEVQNIFGKRLIFPKIWRGLRTQHFSAACSSGFYLIKKLFLISPASLLTSLSYHYCRCIKDPC